MNGYVKAVLALEAVRRKREDRYDRFVRPLDRKRDALAAEVAARVKALSGGQYAEARRMLTGISGVRSPLTPEAAWHSIGRDARRKTPQQEAERP